MGKATKAKVDPLARRLGETHLQWRSRIVAANQNERDKAEPIVPAVAQDGYKRVTVMHIETNTRAETFKAVELPPIIEQWHKRGLPGFEEPAMNAMRRCIVLWEARPQLGRQSASYSPAMAVGKPDYDGHIIRALDDTAEIDRYKAMFHPAHWRVYERVVRDGQGVADAGREIEGNGPQSTASARAIVGTVANFIAMKMRR